MYSLHIIFSNKLYNLNNYFSKVYGPLIRLSKVDLLVRKIKDVATEAVKTSTNTVAVKTVMFQPDRVDIGCGL